MEHKKAGFPLTFLRKKRKTLYENHIIRGVNYPEQIKFIRETLLVTQTELAEMLGVTFATINRWENGRFEPSIRQKRAIKDLCRRKKIPWNINQNGKY